MVKKIGLSFKFRGYPLTVAGWLDEAGALSLLYVELNGDPQALAQLLSIKPERGSLLTDIEYEAREAWAKQ